MSKQSVLGLGVKNGVLGVQKDAGSFDPKMLQDYPCLHKRLQS